MLPPVALFHFRYYVTDKVRSLRQRVKRQHKCSDTGNKRFKCFMLLPVTFWPPHEKKKKKSQKVWRIFFYVLLYLQICTLIILHRYCSCAPASYRGVGWEIQHKNQRCSAPPETNLPLVLLGRTVCSLFMETNIIKPKTIHNYVQFWPPFKKKVGMVFQ